MSEKERAELDLENRLLKLEKAVQQLMLTQIETKLEERNVVIGLLDLDDIEERQPGLV